RNRLNGDLGSIFRYYTGKSQFKKEGDKWLVRDHMFGFFVEIGFFFANGAFKLATDKLTGKRYIDVDYIKLAKVGRDLFREIPDGHMKTGQLWPGQNRPAAELV
ncbi:MAG: hypothetical protein L6406_16865, partial [Desulfobacterales bacterium]|nr:hypothetical protein [Desulfobacterales bacterium]